MLVVCCLCGTGDQQRKNIIIISNNNSSSSSSGRATNYGERGIEVGRGQVLCNVRFSTQNYVKGDGKRSKVVAGRTRKAGVDKKVAVGADNPSR